MNASNLGTYHVWREGHFRKAEVGPDFRPRILHSPLGQTQRQGEREREREREKDGVKKTVAVQTERMVWQESKQKGPA